MDSISRRTWRSTSSRAAGSKVSPKVKQTNGGSVGLRSKAKTTLQALSLLGVKRARLLVLSSMVERQAAAQKSPLVYARLFARAGLRPPPAVPPLDSRRPVV